MSEEKKRYVSIYVSRYSTGGSFTLKEYLTALDLYRNDKEFKTHIDALTKRSWG